jgi:uncharacterized protein DUF6188
MLDHAFHLQFLERQDPITVMIESEFTLVNETGSRLLHPEHPGELGPAFALFGATVRVAEAYKKGALRIEFEDGREIVVAPDNQYEAWGLASDGGVKIICPPSGGLSVWK